MEKKTTKCISVGATLLLASTMLFTAYGLSTGSEKTHASADDEQGKLLYIVDAGRVNDTNGGKLTYGYNPEISGPDYVSSTVTFIKRNGGSLGDITDDNGTPLTRLLNSYTDHPFGEDPKTNKNWGFIDNYSTTMQFRLGRAGEFAAGYSEFRSVNDSETTTERLVYKFEVPDDSPLDVTVFTHAPTVFGDTVEGKMSVNGGDVMPLVAHDYDANPSIPDCKGVLNPDDNKYYLTLTFGEEGAQTVVNGIIIREKPYDITYNLGGGMNNSANKATYTYGAGFTLADPTRTGYTFDGWYDAEEGGEKITAISDTQKGNVTLYARWTAQTYTVTYNLGGGTNNAANEATYTYGAGFTLAEPTRTNYTFDGWYDAENGGNKVTAISNTQTGNVTLYARWTAPTYTITYNLDGGTNHAANKATYDYGAGFTLAAPTRTGYTFEGWYDAEEGGNKVTAISDTQTGDVTLYARWTKNAVEEDKTKNGGCNSNIGGTASLFGGLLLLSAGAIVVLKCKKKN